MVGTFEYTWDTPVYKGKTTLPTGLFINGKFVDGVKGQTIE
jgi:aldehyde dehydrogenase (NAD+)